MNRFAPDDVWRPRAQRVLGMVAELHARGYQGLRVLPGINASGTWWRCAVFPKRWYQRGSGIPNNAFVYSASTGDDIFGLGHTTGLSVTELANVFAHLLPLILAESRVTDPRYAHWFAGLLAKLDQGFLPVAYADWYEWRPPPGRWALLGPTGEWHVCLAEHND